MNISTGGPHILLFERDQQFATLLLSEFQLAGYEFHTARTAVEVFDAIARYPVQLVLVNLAQAAAARREFWAALVDAQRRVRGLQVLTFLCTNLAGYGPRDPDERSHGVVPDMEIDGMLGLMNLVNAVRERVPHTTPGVNTMARVPRSAPAPTPRPVPTQSMPAQYAPGGAAMRPAPSNNNMIYQSASRLNTVSFSQPTLNTSPPPMPPLSPMPGAQGAGVPGMAPPSHTEKIRAVLYPNQRTWSSSQGIVGITPVETNKATYDNQMSAPPVSPMPVDTPVLRRLANQQAWIEEQRESGLAQLSRLAQTHQSSPIQERGREIAQPVQEMRQIPTDMQTTQSNTVRETGSVAGNYIPPTPRPTPTNETISAQPLRAAPIQDLPIERGNGSHIETEGVRRPDAQTRSGYTNYGQPPAAPAPMASLSSISTPVPPPTPPTKTTYVREEQRVVEEAQHITSTNVIEEASSNGKGNGNPTLLEQAQAELQKMLGQGVDADTGANSKNAMLLDIMQSLPPMPSPPPAQSVQPQVLQGRATRSLGSVLLAGHLVPENRLEVAQNIQRMLRGVDMNYQLGEILLMFKLLTPDQLLAASLVSYGLITTTQISALGRIRQELHAIGLEYDLENLLILFRILTTEQLREVRSGWQG